MRKYKINIFILISIGLCACGNKLEIANLTFKKDNYEILYYYGNALSSNYLKIKKNGETKYFNRISTDSIESIYVTDKKLCIILDYYACDTKEVSDRDTIIIK